MLSIVHAQVLQWTARALRFARLADLSAEADDIQMGRVIGFGRQQVRQDSMHFFSAYRHRAQAQPPRDPIDVGVYWKGRFV
jgi:hypothetical protein